MTNSKLTPGSSLDPIYGRPEFARDIPRGTFPEESMEGETAYTLINDELGRDIAPKMNMASFLNTTMDTWGKNLVIDSLGKNFIDHEEYPQTNVLANRICWMIGEWYGTEFSSDDTPDLWKSGMYGSVTIGSSEAVMLALVAHRERWKIRNAGSSYRNPNDRPFFLTSTHVHTCWDKFGRYYDVGQLYVPMKEGHWKMTGSDVAEVINKPMKDSVYWPQIKEWCKYPDSYDPGTRTVGDLIMVVGCVVGTTYGGLSDEVEEIGLEIDKWQEKHPSESIPIHVDAASGGFILPFTNETASQPVKFNFSDVPNVQSINVSIHKFGNTYPGCGLVVFRNGSYVPRDLIYDISYLGGSFTDFTVNFSRGSAVILAAYYNLIRMGKSGYRKIIANCMANATELITRDEAFKDNDSQLKILHIHAPAHNPL